MSGMTGMWDHGLWGRGTQREEKQRNRRKEHEASSREEETLRNNQIQAIHVGSSEENHNITINTIKSNTNKRAAVCSDGNHLARGRSKKPRRETTKGEAAGVSNPGGVVAVAQEADKDDVDQQGLNRSLFQPCSKGDAADARIRKLEQELHILEEELKNENQPFWEEDEKLYADTVHTTREATSRASGAYRARYMTMLW
jgi:hypothetical protein